MRSESRLRARGAQIALFLLSCLLVPALAGCEWDFLFDESEQEQVRDTAEEWVEVHDMNPTNEDGSVNVDGAAKVAKRVVTGSTGDPEVDASLNSDNVVARIDTADALEEQGWKENNPKWFDQAIKLRPEDWKYYISRAAWNMDYYATPRMDMVDDDFEKAEKLLGPDKQERIAYAQQGIAQMESVKVTMSKPYSKGEQAPLFSRPHDCRTVFSRLAHFYSVLADQTGDAGVRAQAEQCTRDLEQCVPEK